MLYTVFIVSVKWFTKLMQILKITNKNKKIFSFSENHKLLHLGSPVFHRYHSVQVLKNLFCYTEIAEKSQRNAEICLITLAFMTRFKDFFNVLKG